MYQKLPACRVCGSKSLSGYLDLGEMPLANSLVRPEAKGKKELFFPLEVLFCNDCCLSQLSVVVDPKVLFWGYVYRSSVSKTFQRHCRGMALNLREMFAGKKGLSVLDIASNDGCLLVEFMEEGFKVMGVEPATNLAEIAISKGIPTIDLFWGSIAAKKVLKGFGKVDVVTATNVLGHVNDVHAFVRAAKLVLKEQGLFVVEVPTVANIVKKNQFDTIYHEHLSYFLLKPLAELFSRNGMEIVDVQEFEIHGGTMRVFAAFKGAWEKNSVGIERVLEKEEKEGMYFLGTYIALKKDVEKIRRDLVSLLKELKSEKKRIVAYGASAKGSTLLNYCNIGTEFIDFVIHDTPEKQNCWTPGNHLPIFPSSHLEEKKPDFLLLLAWNFSKELISKTPLHMKRGGKYIIPIPEVKIVSSVEEL